ncbi:hypothetical protein AACH06_11105 [Ideonella sp. DXS29W]|uniref:DUF7931 domain-containing protein n=1 Tax=Ideonella lacteola TaxID=2984193 RepID=A0ABU9BNL6_9BURK
MSNTTTEEQRRHFPAGPVTSRAEFQAAVRTFIREASPAGVRHMWWVSPDFAEWPLDEPELLDALMHWARAPGVRITWVCQDFERVRRAMPRLTRWRQTFSHVLSCRMPEEVAVTDMPTLLVSDQLAVLRLMDRERVRGYVRVEPADVQHAHEEIDVILQRSSDAFPAVTLGL